MHIIINAVGSSGDINPMLILGTSLAAQGHRVDFLANPVFEERVKRCGLRLIPLGTTDQYNDTLKNPEVWNFQTAFESVWALVMKAAKDAYHLIQQNYEPTNTLLIGTSLAVGARLAQEKLGLPMISVHLSPAVMLSAYNTPQSPTNPMPEFAPVALKSLWINAFDKLMLDRICRPSLNSLRAELSLPPVKQVVTKWLHSPDMVLCAFPDWFASVQADWPPNCVTTNFPIFKSSFDSELSEELERFLEAGPPPLVITAGTAMAFARDFIRTGLSAAEKAGMRALVVCAFEDQLPELTANSMHVKYANFELLFKRAGMVVHHGGIGTSATSLAGACPQIISPFAHDQFDNGMRLERLGVGKMLRGSNKVSEWASSIRAMQSSAIKENCREFAQKINGSPSGELLMTEAVNRFVV